MSNKSLKGAESVTPVPDPQPDVRPDWLDRLHEPIVAPDLLVIDAHHHLWDISGRRYLFDEFRADVGSGHLVRATVYVECKSMYRASGPAEMKSVGETEFAAGIAAQSASGRYGPARMCAAIVGPVDFALGDRVAPVLEAHIQAAGGRFRGVRGPVAWHASPDVHIRATRQGVLREASTHAAIARLQRLGLTLDIWAFFTQMDEVLDICRAFPDLTVIVCHAAGPVGIGVYRGRRAEVFALWSQQVRRLAALPNTVMKLGGMGMRFMGDGFELQPDPPSSDQLTAAWQPYVDTCIAAFGPSRCMFESNFPVDKTSCSYPVLWNAFKKMGARYDDGEQAQLLSGTAARVYRISEL